MTDFDRDLATHGIEIAAERLSNDVAQTASDDTSNLAEIVQTKVTGPGITVDNSVVRFSGTDGVTIQPSGVIVDDNDNLKVPGGVQAKAGSTTGFVKLGGVLADHSADIGNSGTNETDLYTDTVPANAMDSNGDKLSAEYGGTFVASATATKRIKIYFGGNVIFDSTALSLSLSSSWVVHSTLIRVSPTVMRHKVSFTTQGATLSAYTSVGEVTGLTLTNDNILKITGTAGGIGAATNDIVAKLGTVSWMPGA